MKNLVLIVLCTLLIGCAGLKAKGKPPASSGRYKQKHDSYPKQSHVPNLHKIKNAVPKVEPPSRYGNPNSYKVFNKKYHVLKNSHGYKETGLASWYGTKFHGHRTSNGEVYDMYAMTAAHKTLPLPTYIEVVNLDNGRKVIVKVNDRGPFHDNRIVDLSYAAAHKLGILSKGTGRVEVRAIDPRKFRHRQPFSSPTPQESETIIAQAAPPSTDTIDSLSSHYLQVGAFSNKDNAENLVLKLQSHTELPIEIQAEEANSPLFRVRIGPISEATTLAALKTRLSEYEFHDTLALQQ